MNIRKFNDLYWGQRQKTTKYWWSFRVKPESRKEVQKKQQRIMQQKTSRDSGNKHRKLTQSYEGRWNTGNWYRRSDKDKMTMRHSWRQSHTGEAHEEITVRQMNWYWKVQTWQNISACVNVSCSLHRWCIQTSQCSELNTTGLINCFDFSSLVAWAADLSCLSCWEGTWTYEPFGVFYASQHCTHTLPHAQTHLLHWVY